MSKSEKAQLKMKTANHLFGKYDWKILNKMLEKHNIQQHITRITHHDYIGFSPGI
jgi:hypothetical protein